MCDTFVALPDSTGNATTLFGKNSDRQRNEAHAVETIPRTAHAIDAQVRCTYLTIPQARATNAVIIARPYWIWGAEMGANQYGVAIGNEGLVARTPSPETPALTGMDLVRLALERASCAAEGVDIITSLLERYGQGGNCGHLAPSYYNNGFIICDPDEAFIVETIDREWLVKRVTNFHAISNVYSIDCPDVVSPGAQRLLVSTDEPEVEGYAAHIAAPNRELLGQASERRSRVTTMLRKRHGQTRTDDFFRILRDHGANEGEFHPRSQHTCTVCMHAGLYGDGSNRGGQTTGSFASELYRDAAVHWVTATAAPCISIFKPLFIDTAPPRATTAGEQYDAASLWWRHERMHRAVLRKDYPGFLRDVSCARDGLEEEFRQGASLVRAGTAADRQAFVDACWTKADALEREWANRLRPTTSQKVTAYDAEWQRHSVQANVP